MAESLEDIEREILALKAELEKEQDKEGRTLLRTELVELRKTKNILLEQRREPSTVLALDKLLDEKLEPFKQALAERISRTVSASKISAGQLESVRIAISSVRVHLPLTEDEDEDALDVLLAASSSLQPNRFWAGDPDSSEPSQRGRYAAELKANIPASAARRLEWLDVKNKGLAVRLGNACFPVSAKNDELLIVKSFHREPECGAVLGVEVKKVLGREALRQAEVEFYVWSNQSNFPYAQLVTDMGTGGVIFYCRAISASRVEVVQHVLVGMAAVYGFVNDMVAQLPLDMGTDDMETGLISLPDDLPTPKRVRLHHQLVTKPSLPADELLVKMACDREDVGCMRDVEEVEMQMASLSPLSYFS